jgi:hypothetical protein
MSLRNMSLSIGAALLGLAATGASAAPFIVQLTQVGPDVVATGSGTFDLSPLTGPGFGGEQGYLAPTLPIVIVGGPTGGGTAGIYGGSFSGPSNFGSGTSIAASISSGDFAGIAGLVNLIVPIGYVSDTPLSDSATFSGQTLSSLGITPGTYIWSWGSGPDDSYTLVATVPEPTCIAALAIPAAIGLLRRRRVADLHD